MRFADIGLSDELLRALSEAGYDEPTPIQAAAIPQVQMMRDIIAIAQTGTGKTASFVLPMIDVLANGRARARMPRSLILEPTRELAAQVAENFEKYGKYHKLSMALLIGGVQMGDQVKALEKGDHNMARETALPLLGFGPGLTPSGDDFVGAALFARQLVDDSREWLDVARALSEAITTRSNVISAALFRDLIQGQSFAPLHEMVSALVVHESVDRAMEAAKRLTGVGQSSGWDMFAGFVAGATGTL